MEVYYDKSVLVNDKTYQFIRNLDMPVESNGLEEELPYKPPNKYIKDTIRRRYQSTWNNQGEVSHQSNNTAPLVSKHCVSPKYYDVNTGENRTIPEYSQGVSIYNYNHTNESFSKSQFNQQYVKNYDTSKILASSQNNHLNSRSYSSGNAVEFLAEAQNNLGDYDDTHKNLATSQYSLCDVRSYTNNTVIAAETPKDNQVASAVWDVIDPHGKVRGLPESVPETPIFTTGIVAPSKDSDSHEKRVIHRFHNCVLYAPSEHFISKPKVDRPDGCKTIFISGLPEKMNQSLVREVFEKSGKIHSISLRKTFCFVEFASTFSVDKALKLSGCRVVIGDRREAPFCSRIHVDFVPSRRVQHEYERAKQLKKDAMRAIERDARNPIRPLLPYISEEAATTVVDQLRNEDSLEEGVKSLIKWMEEGKCNSNNADSFFSFLQAMKGFVSRLMKDTAKVEEEVHQHKCQLNGKYAANSSHFITILKAFDIATSKKIWYHFSKTQRSRIVQWKKHIEEIKESNSQDLISNRVEENMDLSDDDSSSIKQQGEELKRLQEENEQLKSELKSLKDGGLKKEQKNTFKNCGEVENAVTEDDERFCGEVENAVTENNERFSNHSSSDNVEISAREARLIALVGAFLNFHRFGEHVDSIYKYIMKIDSSFSLEEIQSLLRKFPTVFKESFHEKKWTFLGL